MPAHSAPSTSALHTLVLAAGRGTRMGTPKALLTIADQPWWRIQSQRLAATGIPVTWVISDHVRAAFTELPDAPVNVVIADSAAPMFTSILTGLRALAAAPAKPRGVFILPVDSPAPESSVWKTLAAAGENDLSPVAVPTYQNSSGHPVFLRWSWIEGTLFPATKTAADPGSLRLDILIAPFARTVPVSDPSVAINLNTPDDVRAYLATRS